MAHFAKIESSKVIDIVFVDNSITHVDVNDPSTEEEQRGVIKKVVSKLDKEEVANDINGYPKAPPSIRIWGGSTVQNSDMKVLLPWIDWAYNSEKNNA